MTANTDILTTPTTSDTAGREVTGPPPPHPPSRTRLSLGWIALTLATIAVAALAFATFTGGDDRDIPAQGFYPQAEQWEREAHLEGNARTYGRAATARDAYDGEFLPGSRHVPTR
jgi:hypothetical protein